MADIMEDSLTGSVTKLSSAWDGLILSFSNSTGVLRDVTDDLTDIVSVFGSDKISGLQKFLSFQALLTGNVKVFNDLADSLKKVAKAEDEAAKKQSEYITDSATVLLRDYGYNVAAITDALYDNKDAFEILAEVEKLHTAAAKANAEATAENIRKQLAANEALKARIALEKDRNAALSRGQNVTSGVPSVSGFDTSKLNFTPDTKAADSFTAAQKAIQDSIDLSNSKQREQYDLLQQNQQSWISFGATVGGILNNVISSDRDFLASVQKTVAGILQANATQIASWLAVKFAKDSATKTPVAAIALLTAAIGVVSGLLGKDWKRGGVGGGGRYGGGNLSSTRSTDFAVASNGSQNSAPTITGVIRGQDLYVILENYKRNNQYTMSGG